MYAVTSRGLLVLSLLACQTGHDVSGTGPAETPAPVVSTETVALRTVSLTDTHAVVDLEYRRRPEQPGPRVAELQLALTGVEFQAATAGDSASRAGKQLVAQPSDGRLRLVLYGTGSLERLDSGTLAQLTLRRTGPVGRLELLSDDPVFAPSEANDGVLLGAPLTLGSAP